MQPSANLDYDARLHEILENGDFAALREFARTENQISDDVYAKDEHFWEVLLHKLICNRLDMLIAHASSRAWLSERGYTTDLAGY